jgi:hypothetical protein
MFFLAREAPDDEKEKDDAVAPKKDTGDNAEAEAIPEPETPDVPEEEPTDEPDELDNVDADAGLPDDGGDDDLDGDTGSDAELDGTEVGDTDEPATPVSFEVKIEVKLSTLYNDFVALLSLFKNIHEVYVVALRRLNEDMKENKIMYKVLESYNFKIDGAINSIESILDGSFETNEYNKLLTIFISLRSVSVILKDSIETVNAAIASQKEKDKKS